MFKDHEYIQINGCHGSTELPSCSLQWNKKHGSNSVVTGVNLRFFMQPTNFLLHDGKLPVWFPEKKSMKINCMAHFLFLTAFMNIWDYALSVSSSLLAGSIEYFVH